MEIQKRFIAAYDEDIGWCEQLRRELQKEGIGLEEMESVQELAQYSEKTEKKKSLWQYLWRQCFLAAAAAGAC